MTCIVTVRTLESVVIAADSCSISTDGSGSYYTAEKIHVLRHDIVVAVAGDVQFEGATIGFHLRDISESWVSKPEIESVCGDLRQRFQSACDLELTVVGYWAGIDHARHLVFGGGQEKVIPQGVSYFLTMGCVVDVMNGLRPMIQTTRMGVRFAVRFVGTTSWLLECIGKPGLVGGSTDVLVLEPSGITWVLSKDLLPTNWKMYL
jgi:hypothetical protein